jgi:hypothetical protein
VRVSAVILSLLGAGCVDTTFVDGQFLCEPGGAGEQCPSGLACAGDGLCRSTAVVDGSGGGIACVPITCADMVGICGAIDDGCGSLLDCGCTAPLSCSPEGACTCPLAQKREPSQALNDGLSTEADWVNEGKIFKTGDGYAVTANSLTPGQTTRRLYAFDFGFEIPEGVTITGYELRVRRSKFGSGIIRDEAIRLMRAKENIAGIDQLSTTAWSDTLDLYTHYGSWNDDWNVLLDRELINSEPFGIAIRAKNVATSGNATPRVEHVTLTVHFRCD